MFPYIAYDQYGYINARTEFIYSIKTIMGKVFVLDRLFKGNLYIERILEQLISNEDSILTAIGKNNMFDTISRLSNEYYNLKLKKGEQDFDKWIDRYTLIFYELLISGKIDDYIISNLKVKEILSYCKPNSTTSINMGLKILKLENLINKEKAEFNLSTYSFEVFKSLIKIMNVETIDILYEYLILKRIRANQHIAASFIIGIDEVYFREKSYLDYYIKICESIGHRWEELCRKIARYLYGDVLIIHPKLDNGKIPDMSLQNKFDSIKYSHLIECKRSFNILDIEESILKYDPYCRILEFWILESMFNKGTWNNLQKQRDSYLENIKKVTKLK